MGVLYCKIYVFSSCLRAPRKIDSSIGLPSLNKVVTYLLAYLSRVERFIDICLIISLTKGAQIIPNVIPTNCLHVYEGLEGGGGLVFTIH